MCVHVHMDGIRDTKVSYIYGNVPYFILTFGSMHVHTYRAIKIYSAKWVTVALQKVSVKFLYQLIFPSRKLLHHLPRHPSIHLLELVRWKYMYTRMNGLVCYSNITSLGVIIFEIYRVICRFVIQLGYKIL